MLAIAALSALALALPGQTETTRYTNDLLIFLDGAYRISWGQVPNRDFHSALGPLTYYIPAAGYVLTGSLGAAMPVGTALLIALVTPVLLHVVGTRLRPTVAIPFAALVILVIAAPMNLGERITDLSFAMFYNRIGWALLSLLLIMHLPPMEPHRHQLARDALSAAFLVVLLCYLKISYGAVGFAFLLLMLLDAGQRRAAALAIGISLAAALVVELFWRSSGDYLADLRLAADVSGGLRGGLAEAVNLVHRNIVDYTLFFVLAGFALWRTRSLRDLIFFGLCAASGYLLLNQNFQAWGMVTLYGGGAVAAELLLRQDGIPGPDRQPQSWAAGAKLVLIGLLLPTVLTCATALGIHAVLAAKRSGVGFALPNFAGIRLVELLSPEDFEYHAGYIDTLRTGADALRELGPDAGRVLTLDFVTPFNAGLGLEPPVGDSTWQHVTRTFDHQHFVPAEELLAGVHVVLEPKHPVERFTYYGLRDLYLPYLHANYEFAGENVNWWVWVAKDKPAQ